MVRDAERHPAFRRERVEVAIAFVVAAEGDLGAVYAEARVAFGAWRASEGESSSAFPWNEPKIVCVDEHDARVADIWVAEHPCLSACLRGSSSGAGEAH